MNIYIKIIKFFTRSGMYKWLDLSINNYFNNNMNIVLNIGHGGPVYEHLIKSKITKLQSLDLNPELNPDIVASIENMHMFKDNSVDMIICMEVLEHVKNPFMASNEIYRILKPNGILIASTVFIYPLHEVPFDYFRYTKYGIKEVFKKMKKVELIERNKYIFSIYALLMRLGMNKKKSVTIISILTFPILLLLLPFFILLNIIFDSDYATTGYYFIYKK